MNLLCCNCKGTTAKGFVGPIRDLKNEFSFSMLMLFETHVRGDKANRIIRRKGFDGKFILERLMASLMVYGAFGTPTLGQLIDAVTNCDLIDAGFKGN